MLTDDDLAVWIAGLDDLFALVAGRFFRVEPRWRARAYVRGLLAPLASKNGWTLAEAAGDGTPDGMQRLLSRAAWDVDGVRDDVRAYVAGHLGSADGVLIVDETGFLKKGVKSAGVQRQYSGTAGRVENCQLGVFCAYATSRGRALVDRELYLPKSWTEDRDRCREAGVPADVQFATKPELARMMLGRGRRDAGRVGDRGRGLRPGRQVPGLAGAAPCRLRRRCGQQAGDRGRRRDLPRGCPGRARPRPGMEAPQLREWLQRPPGLRLGGRHLARRRRTASRLVPVPAGPRVADPQRQGRAGTRLLPVLRSGRHARRGTDPGGRIPVGHRRVLPDSQERAVAADQQVTVPGAAVANHDPGLVVIALSLGALAGRELLPGPFR
jgi:DDE superfamily endonuclease